MLRVVVVALRLDRTLTVDRVDQAGFVGTESLSEQCVAASWKPSQNPTGKWKAGEGAVCSGLPT